ncbi:ATP-dependent DNA helicase RecG [Parasporobacterium paucivorans DSM 15970]|uniref:ATP-dependent DNA helicase RecG n=1 Tax=Parasporobacterium paucivorans DSM 15970 TaxID=1122934 RepID=A0A1M6ADS8_9FIRM|nr:ATP-dependent DNA helicase RecG [Parasporobacterium paucivorans]SHI34609.1 ATP-dependent DNA helicase RecG [Parasporobacterium paucivorans DSM 15970]
MKLTQLRGIGEKTEKLLNKLGIYDVNSLVSCYPRNYETFEPPIPVDQIRGEGTAAVRGTLKNPPTQKRMQKFNITAGIVTDEHGSGLKVIWFNMPFLKNTLKTGHTYVFRGRIGYKSGIEMEQPAVFTPQEYAEMQNTIFPRYGLTEGLNNKTMQKAVKQALGTMTPEESLPGALRSRYELISYEAALQNIHFPEDFTRLSMARKRLAFEEFFLFICTLRHFREQKEMVENEFGIQTGTYADRLMQSLPYDLTKAQKRALQEIRDDLRKKQVMSRLVQGDVGSGKTIVALLALLDVAENGFQGALMAPTEVLAVQHYKSITEIFENHNIPFSVVLLTGSTKQKERTEVCRQIEEGEADIVIGTHALFQKKVIYNNLALVITDEQHRFGVKQREIFSKKGKEPNVLVMSATPIPRTLALILYGDLDISVIDELPQGRQRIRNCVILQNDRPKSYKFIFDQVKAGRQAYVICPMVEENDEIEAENVIGYSERLQKVLGKEIHVEYLHGQMKPGQKNKIMEEFADGMIDVLVSTTVIEVGVNVPNATVMMIENAERFGLATLHQLRGRVGRGEHLSYCIFVSGTSDPETLGKLDILNKTNDGFVIAEEDLKSRGPGDIFGNRQSGELRFKAGDIYQDADLIRKASEAAGWFYGNLTQFTREEIELVEKRCRLTKELLML